MANVVSRGNGKVNTITASCTLQLGDAGQVHVVSRWIVQFVLTGGTFTLKPQKAATISDPESQLAFQDCWYTDAMANAAVAAGVTQVATGEIDIDAAGNDVQLVITVSGGGVLTLVANPMLG
jgi:hypothetical protein